MHGRWPCVAGVACLALLTMAAPRAAASDRYETAPVRTATQIQGAAKVQGPGYTIREKVDPRGYLNHYEVESSFGLYRPNSDRMLRMRLHEIATMKRLMTMGGTNAYMKSLEKRLVSLPTSLVGVAKNPVKAVGKVPKAVTKTFGRVGSFLDDVTKPGGGQARSPQAIRAGLVSSQKRRLALELKVDVFSTNSKLQQLLDDVATARYAGEMTVSLASYAIPGGAGSAVYSTASWNTDLATILGDKTEDEIVEYNRAALRQLGIHDFVVRKFLDAPHLSPRHESVITQAMKELRGVQGLDAIPQAAMEAADEARALLQEQQAIALAYYHRRREPLQQLEARGGLVVARTRSGRALVLAPVDLLWLDVETDRLLAVLRQTPLMRSAAKRDLEVKGRVTQRFVDRAGALGFRVISGWPWLPQAQR